MIISIKFHNLTRCFQKSIRIMSCSVLSINTEVRGLKVLDRKLFEKTVKIPCLELEKHQVSNVMPTIKKYVLKLENFKPVQPYEDKMLVYLQPDSVKDCRDLKLIGNILIKDLTLTYENFTYEAIFKAIIPEDIEGFSSFTKIGHIVHVNLREHLLPYRKIIGDVLLDKVKNCRTVVNKIDMIDNTYRNFQMEILCGENNTLTSVKENNCLFEFDFSEVYWNSRLCTEHERLIKTVKSGDLFIDVFAGVGPFSIPIAKKRCKAYSNDLNPGSYKWLNHNIKLNKIKLDYIKTYNKDGNDFIKTDVKEILTQYLNKYKIHIAMNLPALAVEFLQSFVGLLRDNPIEIYVIPNLYVYCFAKGSDSNTDYVQMAKDLILKHFNFDVTDKILDVFEVRTVSNFKKMMRVTLKLDGDLLFRSVENYKRKNDYDENPPKNFKGENGEEKDK